MRLHEDSNTKESNICIGSVVDLPIGFRVAAAVDERCQGDEKVEPSSECRDLV